MLPFKSKYPTSTPKVDQGIKVRGEAKYTDDIVMPGMLFAKTVRSSIAHGEILSIQKPKLPEGYYWVDHKDIKGENVVNIIFSDWPVFAEKKVNFIGEPIALIVGPNKGELDRLVNEVKIEYKEETPVFDFTESYIHKAFTKGDIASAKKKAVKVIEEEFSTGYQEQAYLEPQGLLVYYDEEHRVTCVGSVQCPWYVHRAVVRACAIPTEKVRVIQPAVGGAFGGKEHYPSLLAAQLATAMLKINKPIKMCFERPEDITFTTKRHPSKSKYIAYVDKDNNILGMDVQVKLNGGAYKGCSGVVLSRALIACVNVYNIPALNVAGDVYMTNTVPTAAFRGFGSPQTIFASEMFIHHVAKDLGVDPLELRMKYLVKEGDITTNSGKFHDPIILPALIEKAMEMSDYKRKIKEYSKPGCNKGIGMSFFLHGCGFTGSGESDIIKGKVKLIKDEKDIVHVYASSVDMGQGNKTTLKRIVAKNLDIPNEQVVFDNPDTSIIPDSGPTAASRTIIIVGFLMEKAAKNLKKIWKSGVRQEHIEPYVGPSYIKWDEETMQGDAYPSYAWGVNVVEVEFDPITYQIETKGVWSTYDVGRVVDERIAVGQADGGIVQGLGYGYMETMRCEKGRFRQRSLSDYIVPTAEDIPHMETAFIDNPFIYGADGAKGMGELTLVGGAPAIALAIENAIGKKVNDIPCNPEYIMELMKNGKN
ncbi:MAG: xanthine dehydrogenase family protein molybdopterin-binding subunit [Bacilli bacterium]|nr:xanthine dehydrogenase family protein molybdopterin-binding subunit [Bacilli bacterium]